MSQKKLKPVFKSHRRTRRLAGTLWDFSPKGIFWYTPVRGGTYGKVFCCISSEMSVRSSCPEKKNGIQYLVVETMVGRNAICICGLWNIRQWTTVKAGRDPKKCFSAVSCSNLALRILKLRRENFKQTGSSIFKIGWELRSPQSIECTSLQQPFHLLNIRQLVGTTLNAGEGPQKWFSAVSCSTDALTILKLRREDFKQTGSSTFKIGWELSSPQSIVSAYCMGSKWSVGFHRDAPYVYLYLYLFFKSDDNENQTKKRFYP